MALTFGLQQGALIPVGFAIRSTHRALPGDVGAVRGADAAWLAPPVHLAFLSGSAVHVITRFCH